MDKDDEIDKLLTHFTFENHKSFSAIYAKYVNFGAPEGEVDALMREMISAKLIRKSDMANDSMDFVILDSFGDRIKRLGGWKEHKRLEKIKAEEQSAKSTKELNEKVADRRLDRVVKYVGIFAGISTIILSVLSSNLYNSNDEKYDTIIRMKSDSIESYLKISEYENQLKLKDIEILNYKKMLSDSTRDSL